MERKPAALTLVTTVSMTDLQPICFFSWSQQSSVYAAPPLVTCVPQTQMEFPGGCVQMMQILLYFKRHGNLTKTSKCIFFLNQRCYFSVRLFFSCKLTSFLNYYHYIIVVFLIFHFLDQILSFYYFFFQQTYHFRGKGEGFGHFSRYRDLCNTAGLLPCHILNQMRSKAAIPHPWLPGQLCAANTKGAPDRSHGTKRPHRQLLRSKKLIGFCFL